MSDLIQDRLRSFEMHWYVVNTKPHCEKQVEKNIQCIGIESFLPMLQEQRIVRRRQRTVVAPLFPGYLFVRMNLSTHYRAVTYARGVRKVVEFGSSPAQVDLAVLHAIQSRMTAHHVYVRTESEELKSGQRVHIQAGPLVGIDAVFIREMPGRQRAMILLHTLALQARAEVNIDQLVPYVAA